MKNVKFLMLMLLAVLSLSSCENEEEEEKEPNFFTYFQMNVTNCERVGNNLQVDFTMKNISGVDLNQVQLNGGSVWDMCEDNTGEKYYSEISLGGKWLTSVRTSMDKGETISGSFLIKNFNKSIKVNQLNLIFNCFCPTLDFNGRGEIDKIKVLDNRVMSDGIRTNDLGLVYKLVSAEYKTVDNENVADITFTVTNNTGLDLQDFQLSLGSTYFEDNIGEKYYRIAISNGGDFYTSVHGTFKKSSTWQLTIRIPGININSKRFNGSV
ncbi:MAG: hypothetical protein MR541_08475 [Prevotella sp.]|nr:hypothetical protein [Prevotella sp.]